MQLYYRISDNSYKKPKLIGATKSVCLMNFILSFGRIIYGDGQPPEGRVPPLRIIADNCERQTVKMIQDTGLPFTMTDEGNAGSLRKTLEMAMSLPEDELVYFCEDDYLHLSNAPSLLEEGISRSHYVSLYDHPDKYTRFYNMGEICKVFKTESWHWRTTVSTCMTFGTKVKTLKEDWEIWKKYTDGNHPHDHKIFTELGDNGRKLIVPIPGVACHTDLTFSGKMNQTLIDSWAIKMMCSQLRNELEEMSRSRKDMLDISIDVGLTAGDNDWKGLVALDALRQHYSSKAL